MPLFLGGIHMITIDRDTCIGCELCVSDCFTEDIEMVDGKANPKDNFCIECGHCLAICPVNAVTLKDYSSADVISVTEEDRLDPEQLLRWIKTRRTIRQFTEETVAPEDLQKILAMGVHSPKGGNVQNVSFVVIEDNLLHARKLAIESLYKLSDLSESMKKEPNMMRYAKNWKRMYEESQLPDAKDRLFFGAPCVILLVSPSPINACIAASHMETMVYSLGLGMLYSGFTTRAVNYSPELKEYLGMQESDTVQASLIIGHPAVRYERSTPKKLPVVIRR